MKTYGKSDLDISQISNVLNTIPCGFVTILRGEGKGNKVVFVNDYLFDCLGMERVSDYTKLDIDYLDITCPTDTDHIKNTLDSTTEYNITSDTYRLVSKSGKTIWFLATHRTIKYDNLDFIFITLSNMEAFVGSETSPEETSHSWDEFANNINLGLLIFSRENGAINTIAINEALVAFADSVGSIFDQNIHKWNQNLLAALFNSNICAFCTKDDEHIVYHMLKSAERNGSASCTFRLRGSSGDNTVYINSSCSAKKETADKYVFYVTFQNVTSQTLFEQQLKESKEQLFTLSYYDHLTNVQNRNAYTERIENIKQNARHNVGVAFADLNGLKKTNDLFGHVYGDQMIKQFADILMKHFSKEEIFRISGDEFVIVRENVSKESFQDTMYNVIQECISANNIASIGYIWKDKVSDLRRRASQAEEIMYSEKQQYHEYEAKEETTQHKILYEQLIDDLDNNRYEMYLHPRAEFKTNTVNGAEALIRKIDSYGNVILPYEFIPQFEREHLLHHLDFFMLESCCKYLQKHEAIYATPFSLTVNISKSTLSDMGFFKAFTEIINKYNFKRSSLTLEITQSGEKMDKMRLENYIKQIKEYGVSVSLDDVGKDSSSLIMLTMDGIDTITIDRSLIVHHKYPKAGKLLKHMIGMSHELGLKVVAEGVETGEVKNILSEMGCDSYQGFYLSEPLSVEEFNAKYFSE